MFKNYPIKINRIREFGIGAQPRNPSRTASITVPRLEAHLLTASTVFILDPQLELNERTGCIRVQSTHHSGVRALQLIALNGKFQLTYLQLLQYCKLFDRI